MSTSGMDGRDVARLRQYARELPVMERLILMLRFAEDLRPVEIEHITGLSESVVHTVLRRIEAEAGTLLAESRAVRERTVSLRPSGRVSPAPIDVDAVPEQPNVLFG